MSERNPYIPAYIPEGSIRVSCIQHTNISVSDVQRSQEWYKRVFGAEWTEEQPRYLKLGTSEVHIAVRGEANPHPRNHFFCDFTRERHRYRRIRIRKTPGRAENGRRVLHVSIFFVFFSTCSCFCCNNMPFYR